MASISKQPNGRKTIQFVAPDGKRKSIRLGKVSLRAAEAVKLKIEHLASALTTKHAMESDSPNLMPLADLLNRIERCRSSDCEKLVDDVCTMLGGTACKQRSNWFYQLAGGAVCTNWKI